MLKAEGLAGGIRQRIEIGHSILVHIGFIQDISRPLASEGS